jgi:YVTN family beta-propeller protein
VRDFAELFCSSFISQPLESYVPDKLSKSYYLTSKMPFVLGVIAIVLLLSLVVSSFLGHNFFINVAEAHSATTPVGDYPFGIEYNPSNDNIYVTNYFSSTVSVISGSTNSVIDTILVGRGPIWLEYVPSNNQIYVTRCQMMHM